MLFLLVTMALPGLLVMLAFCVVIHGRTPLSPVENGEGEASHGTMRLGIVNMLEAAPRLEWCIEFTVSENQLSRGWFAKTRSFKTITS
jgi:hypothetical protein